MLKMWPCGIFALVFYVSICNGSSCLKKSECPCEIGAHGGILVNCNGRSLTSIPSFELNDLSAQIYEISLKDNNIQDIPAFSFNGTALRKLDFTNNPLTSISEDAFAGVEQSLTELLIGSTRSHTLSITSIPLQSVVNLERLTVSNFNDLEVKEETFKILKKLIELFLIEGYLENISPLAFKSQSETLIKLDLSLNKFKAMPTRALSLLSNLAYLTLTSNNFRTFQEDAFDSLTKLEVLNIDRLNRPVIEAGAFRVLAGSLKVLNMATSSFSDLVIDEIKTLTGLTHLYASYNKFSALDRLLDGSLVHLKLLDLQDNQISKIDRVQSNTLETLILENNPIADASVKAFHWLPSLISLNIKGAKGLKLDESTFNSQSSNLKELRLNQVNLSGSHWKALTALRSLETLEASGCDLSNVPDFMFHSLSQLKTLILDGNDIGYLNQHSFHGLGPSLQHLSLADNKLVTLDECVFYNFKSMNMAKLKLDRNPLDCDCKLNWLYRRIKTLKTQPEMNSLIFLLQWKCNEPNLKFTSLTDDHFKDCASHQPPVCEEFSEFSTTTQPRLNPPELFITDIRSNSFIVFWNGSSYENSHYILSYEKLNGERLNVEVTSQASEQLITGLEPLTAYRVILTIISSGSINQTVQMTASTISWIDEHRQQVIIGTTVGVILFILTLLVFFFIFCLYTRKPNVPMVEITEQSKRYVKHPDYSTVNSRRNKVSSGLSSDPNDIIKSTLNTMSEEEKYRLVNLLTNSRGSLNGLDDDFPLKHQKTKHVYEEIPSDVYDEIAEDRTV